MAHGHGRKFGNQIQSRARKQAVSASVRSSDSGPRSSFRLRLVRVKEGLAASTRSPDSAHPPLFWLRRVRVKKKIAGE